MPNQARKDAQTLLCGHLFEHLQRCQTHLPVDLDTTYVWGILANLCVARSMAPGMPPSAIADIDGTYRGEIHSVRLEDVAQVTGQPRETVRRRLQKLAEMGLAIRDPDGRWLIQQSGIGEDLRRFTIDTVQRLLDTADRLQALGRECSQSTSAASANGLE